MCSAGLGAVQIFEKTDEKEGYKKSKEVKIPSDQQTTDPGVACEQQIMSVTLSPSEETLVCSTSKNQLFSIPLSSADIGKVSAFNILSILRSMPDEYIILN